MHIPVGLIINWWGQLRRKNLYLISQIVQGAIPPDYTVRFFCFAVYFLLALLMNWLCGAFCSILLWTTQRVHANVNFGLRNFHASRYACFLDVSPLWECAVKKCAIYWFTIWQMRWPLWLACQVRKSSKIGTKLAREHLLLQFYYGKGTTEAPPNYCTC